jgi:hypothetical protein
LEKKTAIGAGACAGTGAGAGTMKVAVEGAETEADMAAALQHEAQLARSLRDFVCDAAYACEEPLAAGAAPAYPAYPANPVSSLPQSSGKEPREWSSTKVSVMVVGDLNSTFGVASLQYLQRYQILLCLLLACSYSYACLTCLMLSSCGVCL